MVPSRSRGAFGERPAAERARYPVARDADQLAGLRGRHLWRSAALCPSQRAPGPFGQQARRLDAVGMRYAQPLLATLEAEASGHDQPQSPDKVGWVR